MKKNNKGFTIIEALVVAGFMAIIIILGGGISSKFALRRTVDDTANKITSELNLVKLQAARDGVQYRSAINFSSTESGKKFITLQTTRGDSNRTSSFDTEDFLDTETSHTYQIMNDYKLSENEIAIDFNPNGTAVQARTIVLRPDSEDPTVSKCATIQVTQFGIIRTVIGNWDLDEEECNPIYDKQVIPEEGDDDDDDGTL